MKKWRLLLLSSAAAASFGGSAYGAEWIKAPETTWDVWDGGYVGANIGVARMDATCSPTSNNYYYYGCGGYYGPASSSASDTGLAVGAQAGWDWQVDRHFVLGVVADWDWTDLSHTSAGTYDLGEYGPFQSNVNWLASARGRAGLAVDNTLVYVTGGVAVGGLKASDTGYYDEPYYKYSSIDQAKVGWVAGVGLEHKFGPHLSAFAEALYYDFGNITGPVTYYSSEPYQAEYNFQVIVARLGLNWRF